MTAARTASARSRHLEALVEGQSQVLEMVSQGRPLSDVLETIARWVESQSRDGVLVSVLLLDREGQHLLHGAAPSLPEAYNRAIHGAQIGPTEGSCGTAAFTRHPVIVEDIAHDPLWVNYRELALTHGLRACWSTPLLAGDGRVLGTFAMYYPHPRAPTTDDLHLIRLVSRTAILAIEHKQAEEEREQLLAREQKALQRAETERQRLYDLLMETPAAIALLRGPTHVFELTNPLYLQAIGAGRDVLGMPVRMALPELEGQGFFELLDQAYASGERYEGKEALVQLARYGALEGFYFNFVYQPVKDATGTVDGILVHALDVTDSVRAHHQLEESEERYRTLFRSVPVAVYSCDADGVVQAFNDRAVELWRRAPTPGDSAESYCGSLKRFHLDGQPMPRGDYPIARVLRGEAIGETETEFLIERPDGTRRHVVTHPSPLKNERGEIIGVINCLYDISERKRLERERAELLGIVVHDLGNPLAAMKARVQLLERQATRGNASAASALPSELHGIGELVARMDRLVRDLWDAASIEGGQLVLVRDTCDLARLCRQEAEAAQAASGRSVELAVPQPPVEVEADRDRIGQVIANLLSNALKYSPADRPIVLTLACEEHTDGVGVDEEAAEGAAQQGGASSAFARVSVRDEGPGIPPAALSHLFERFYRVPGIEVLQGERRGLGLGLYICRQLIERHGGQLDIASEVGKGSTFSFTLPLADSTWLP